MRSIWVAPALVAALAAAAGAEEVELVSGEVLKATVVECTDAQTVLDHPLLGRLVIEASKIKEVRPDAPTAEEKPKEPPPEPTPAPAEKEESPWKFKGEVGLNGSQGNSTTADFRVALSGEADLPKRRWKLGTSYLLSENEGERSKNAYNANVRHDWKLEDSKWFPFAFGVYDWDEFEEWDGRVQLGGGIGYQFVEEDDLNVRFRAGGSALKQFGSVDDDVRPEGLLGVEVRKKLSKTQTLEASLTYFPDFEDGGEFRTLTTAAWSVLLSEEDSLHLKIGIENEYDSHNESPFKTHDFKYFIALLFEF